MIKFMKGDLFKNLPTDKKTLIPHVNNNLGKWGAGFVLGLSSYDKKPEIEYKNWHKAIFLNNLPFKLGEVQIVKCNDNVTVANMIGQDGIVSYNNSVPIKYWALDKAMCTIRDQWITLQLDEIRCPFFGTGLAKGNKDIIQSLINKIWIDASIPVTIFEL